MESNKEVNSWLIILLVLLTALLTSWAMLKYKPSQDWNGTAYYYPPQQFAENLSPGVAALREGWQNLQGGWQFAGGATASPVSNSGAAMVGPVINAGAVAPHVDRGTCTNCHMVVGSRQQQIPPIGSTARMGHEYRGVCTNCHRLPDPGRIILPPYVTPAEVAVAAVRPMVAFPTTTPAKVATEGEWLGLEVTPITPLTARQYGIPERTQGLVVAEAEAQAATAGIRAGDMLLSINGMPITQMTDFFQATRNGTMTQGVVDIVRQGQRLSIDLAQTTTQALFQGPNMANSVLPAGGRAAMYTPQGYAPMAPANPDAWGGGQWDGGQGVGAAGGGGGFGPGTCWRQF